MYLVKFRDNWADEMDIEGFNLMTKKEFKEFMKELKENDNDGIYCVSFGSNEWNEYESWENLESRFTCIEITKEEASVIRNTIGEEFGIFPSC